MMTFKEFLLEVKRDNARAKKLADYIYQRQLRTKPENSYYGEFNVIDDKAKYPKTLGYHFAPDSIEDYPLKTLHSKQGGVYLRRIHQFIDDPPQTKHLPIVYDYPDDKPGKRVGWLGDGNHRSSIEKLRGNKTVKAIVRRAVPNDE